MLTTHFRCLASVLFAFSICCKDNGVLPPPCLECPLDFAVIDSEPAFAPNGQFVAFTHADTAENQSGLFVIGIDGTNRKLLFSSVSHVAPTWSADGLWLAFTHSGNIFKITIDGDSLFQLTSTGGCFNPSWSPDGEWIVYDSNRDSESQGHFIWKMRKDGTEAKRIAYDPGQGEIRMPRWTSDGTRIVHIRYLVGVHSSEVFVMDSSGSNPVRLTFNSSTDLYPRSSSGLVTFTSQPPGLLPQIWSMTIQGSNSTQLVAQGYSSDVSFDGSQIVFTDSRSTNGHLWLCDLAPVSGTLC